MIRADPRLAILIGSLLVVAGFVLPFLMVMRIVPSTLLLNFFSYVASVVGMIMGLVGVVVWSRINVARRRGDGSDQDWR